MIEFKHVTKEYPDKKALDDVSLTIENGEFVFIVGETGAGKSTFLKLITKEIEPDSGEIYVNGRALSEVSNREIPQLRRSIGMVFQDFRLLENKTVYENVAFAMEVLHKSKSEILKNVTSVLTSLGLQDNANKFPSQLSGGEQQRVAIARAVINNPTILIADEPTGNLDIGTAGEIMAFFAAVNQRSTTFVMVTHDQKIVSAYGKRVIRIVDGKVVSDNKGGKRNA